MSGIGLNERAVSISELVTAFERGTWTVKVGMVMRKHQKKDAALSGVYVHDGHLHFDLESFGKSPQFAHESFRLEHLSVAISGKHDKPIYTLRGLVHVTIRRGKVRKHVDRVRVIAAFQRMTTARKGPKFVAKSNGRGGFIIGVSHRQ
jgi:hypothetical protein